MARYMAGVAVMYLSWMAISAFSAWAHEWYDPACCSGMDCAEIQSMTRLADGSLYVINRHGDSATFPSGFPIKEPLDGKRHACIGKYNKRPICLYLPAEI